MQFIVFAAFAIVLSIPESGTPWSTLDAPLFIWTGVIGQIAVAGFVGWITSHRVVAKLEAEPAWVQSAQRRLTRGNAIIRGVVLVGLCASAYGTGWPDMVRDCRRLDRVWGLDEITILMPFLLSLVVSWAAVYPADRAIRRVSLELRLWASVPARPVWGLGAFLSFMLRQHVLIIAIPMTPIVVANDFVNVYQREIRSLLFNLAWADQAVLVVIAGLVFLVSPLMLRHVWHTRPLPTGELRDRLQGLCRRVGLTYRDILIWESDGMVVNAAVMGLVRPVRYVLLSDGLLEMMRDEQIEAVFGHEAGHVKRHHIPYFLLFAVLSMLVVGGMIELLVWGVNQWPDLRAQMPRFQDYLHVIAMALIVVIWAFGFGAISRRFEWQADLFGASHLNCSADQCDRPCFVHQTAINSEPDVGVPPGAICATSAALFADALHRIAVLNGIPIEARSWRHSSIANRMDLLRRYGLKPGAVADLERSVVWIKRFLLIGTAIGLAIAVMLYWPG